MAMNYQNFASLGVNLNRQKYGPLDISNVFTSAADLKYYLTKGTFTEGVSEYWYKNANEKIVPYPYEGQVLATVIDGVVEVFVLALDAEGNFETREIAGKIEVDGTTIVKDADGKLSIVAPVDPDDKKTYNFAYANGVYSWVEVDTATAAGQAQAIQGLTDRTVALETAVGDATKGLVKDVADNKQAIADETAAREAAIGKAAEGETAASGVYAAIADALEAAKAYADERDADTVYDDTDVVARIADIEADYLTSADAYDDTELRDDIADIVDFIGDETTGLVKDIADNTAAISTEKTRAEAAEKALGERIDAIDFVDNNELTDAIKDFATTEYVNTELAKKAAQTDLEALQARVEAFLNNTGAATEAIDTLQDLLTYIDEHDDVEISGILADIQAIEGKLEGIDGTVADYVTAAINALSIGDYAKAADLTELAGRVKTLEEKPFDTYATKTEVKTVDDKFANYTTTTDLNTALAGKVDNTAFETFKGENTTAIGGAKDAAIAAAKTETESQIGTLASTVASTYATKNELSGAVEGIENTLLGYVTNDTFTTELAKKADASAVYTKDEVDAKIGTPGIPAEVDSEGNEVTPAVPGTGVFASAYSRAEVDKLLDEVQGGSSASADSVLRQLNTYKSTNDERVGAVETKNGEQDTAIANAQAQADKGVADAKKVSEDLATANLAIAENTRQIGVVDGKITTVNNTLTEKITALEGKDTTIEGNITALQTTVSGHTTTITEQGTKIAALEDKDTELATLIQSNTDKFADYSTTAQMNKAIDDKIAAIPAVDFTGYATETYVTEAIAVVNEEVAKKANADDVYTITAADAKFMTEAQVKSVVDKVVADVSDTDTIEGLVTLVNYVHDNAGDIAQLVSDVATNKTATETNATAIAKNASDIVAINEALGKIVQPKASTEVTVAEDGTLGLGTVSTDKLVQGADTLVLNGGDASVAAAE